MLTRVRVRVLVLLSWLCTRTQGHMDSESWTGQAVLPSGLCRYGNSVECCWGWRQMDRGRCQPYCEQGCKHGECVGPDRCKCRPGYTGKACNQDLNECGLKPRPCKHRCMNTPGSYKCYCLDGHTLQPDGSCRNIRTCYHANCQYGCEVIKGRVRCTCPSPGLQLGPDRRTCVDINECVLGGGGCPHRRKCVNTFGSFVCKCQLGFKLTYINGRYTCIDKDTRPFCSLNPSAPKCRCEDGGCKAPPKVTLEPHRPRNTPPITTTPATTTTATATILTTTSTPRTIPATTTTPATTTSATTSTPATTTSATTTTPATTTSATTTTPATTTSAKTTTPATTITHAAPSTPPATTTTPTTVPATTTTPATTTCATTTTPATTITHAAPSTPPATTTPATTATTKTTTTIPLATTTPAIITSTAVETLATTMPATTTTSASATSITTNTAAPPPPLNTTTPVTTFAVLPTTIATTTAAATTPRATTPSTTTTTPVTPTAFTTHTPTTTASATGSTHLPTTTEQDTTPPTPTTFTTTATTSTVALTTTMFTAVSLVTTTMNNRINKDVTHKQRGDVHIPRHPSYNQLWEFDIELGNTDDYARDDPKVGVLHCTFDHGVCHWMSDREGDLHWQTIRNSAGDSYLSVPELKAGQRSIRGARLGIQIDPPWSHGDVCFSFSHWLTGNHVGVLQLFVKTKGRGQSRYSTAIWSRTSGHGWRQTQVTLTSYSVDKVLLKAERRRGHRGQIAIDDVTLRQGACQ